MSHLPFVAVAAVSMFVVQSSVGHTTVDVPPDGVATAGADAIRLQPGGTPVHEAHMSAGQGFAESRNLTGGLGRPSYVVTSADDSGPGTYRDALAGGDRHITFDPQLDGSTIRLVSPVQTGVSNITLDGSGRDITISGFATKFEGTNIVIAGLTYKDVTGSANEDAITFRNASSEQVFGIYGNWFETASDGLIDIIWNRNHDVYGTICGNTFAHHDKALLVHSGDDANEGGRYHITLCNNLWIDIYQRAPMSRDARVHQYNDVFESFGKPDGAGGGSKAAAASERSQHLLENNIAVPRRMGERTFTGDVTTRPRVEFAGPHSGGQGAIRIEGSLLLTNGGNRATQVENSRDEVFTPPYAYSLLPADEATRALVTLAAGRCVSAGGASVNPCVRLS
jgi:pectate lyase